MKISQIYIYPIKSLRGVSLQSAQATRTGFKYDRRFMLLKVIPADKSDKQGQGKGETTLKNMHVPHFPEMALFETEVVGVGLESSNKDNDDTGKIRVRYHSPGSEAQSQPSEKDGDEETLDIPLTPDTRGLEELAVIMHKSPTKGYNMGEAYNSWFSQRFGYNVVLAYLGDENSRPVLGSFAPRKHVAHREYQKHNQNQNQKRSTRDLVIAVLKSLNYMFLSTLIARCLAGEEWDASLHTGLSSGVGALLAFLFVWRKWGAGVEAGAGSKDERITFADTAPYMVVSSTSVTDVTGRLGGEEMDVKKFRANMVVDGAETAYEEDFWAELLIGDGELQLLLTANCVRCVSLNVDYGKGAFAEGESGKVLKKLMVDRRVDKGAKYSPVFGRYAFLDDKSDLKTVRVGDEVKVSRNMEERSVHDWPGLG